MLPQTSKTPNPNHRREIIWNIWNYMSIMIGWLDQIMEWSGNMVIASPHSLLADDFRLNSILMGNFHHLLCFSWKPMAKWVVPLWPDSCDPQTYWSVDKDHHSDLVDSHRCPHSASITQHQYTICQPKSECNAQVTRSVRWALSLVISPRCTSISQKWCSKAWFEKHVAGYVWSLAISGI